MDDHARRLVDDDEVVVFVDDLERDGFRGGDGFVSLGDLELDDGARGDAIRRLRRLTIDPDEMALDQPGGRGAAKVRGVVGQEPIQPRRRGRRDQALGVGRNTYPASSATTPMLIAESATLNTGKKWKLTKSVTVPNMIRSNPLPTVPPMISPSTASFQVVPGFHMT
jgi:hypothetical protein